MKGRKDGFPRACTGDSERFFLKKASCSPSKQMARVLLCMCDLITRSTILIPGFGTL